MLEEKIRQLEQDVNALRERNARVEADKAWETSLFRTFSLALMTYVFAAALLFFINVPNLFFAALVPAVGFLLSVQSLPALKRWWVERFLKK
jgi:preprotein translocase subunit SecF